MTTRSTFVMIAVVAGLPFLPVPAAAYVRTNTTGGAATAWKTPCVTVEFSLGLPPPEMDAEAYLQAAQTAGAAWTQASLDGAARCSNVIFTVTPVQDIAGPVGYDGHNRLIFRESDWCRDPPPTDPNEPPCYDHNALALTSVFQLNRSGEIIDADLEINAHDHTWADFVAHPELIGMGAHDFQGAVTHEFGHIVGLDHVCFQPGFGPDGKALPRPMDSTGSPAPNCGPGNPDSLKQATMYVSVSSPDAEIGLRSLSTDDIQGACDIYPFKANFVCLPPSKPSTGSGGCSFAPQSGFGGMACGLALLAVVMVLRRRRQ